MGDRIKLRKTIGVIIKFIPNQIKTKQMCKQFSCGCPPYSLSTLAPLSYIYRRAKHDCINID